MTGVLKRIVVVVLAAMGMSGALFASQAAALPAGVTNTIVITNASGARQTNYPLQFGRPFVQGEIAHYPQVSVNGTPVQTQADVKNRFPDGSVKFAILSVVLPSIPAGGNITLSFGDQPSGNNAPLAVRDMLDPAFDFDAQIRLTQGAVTRSASARAMLQDANFVYWTSGPIATTVILQDSSAARKYDLGFDAYRSIHPVFVATFWPGLKKVSVRVVGMDTNTEALEDVTADLAITLGAAAPKTVYAKPGLITYYATVWTKSFWLGAAPEQQINVDHNIAYIAATKFVPNFDPALKPAFTDAVIGAVYNKWRGSPRDINEAGLWQRGMGSTGARPDIGLAPGWMVQWLYTGDWRLREVSLGLADLAGAWRIHMIEGDPARKYDRAQTVPALGRPLSMYARPYERLFRDALANNKIVVHYTVGKNGWTFDQAHEPDPFSIPYMLTGDWWYLFELQMWAASDALTEPIHPNASRPPSSADLLRVASPVIAGYSGQVRGMAWVLRNRARAAFFSPDGTPEQVYFSAITNDMVAVWEGQRGIADPVLGGTAAWKYGNTMVKMTPSPLHLLAGQRDDVFKNTSAGKGIFVNGDTTTLLVWQQNYVVTVLGALRDMGFPTSSLLKWMSRIQIGQWEETPPRGNYDPRLLGTYIIPLRDAGSGPYFSTWQQVQNAISPKEFNHRTANFTKLRGNFGILAYAASTMIANEPGGDGPWNYLKTNIHDKKVATQRFYLKEPGWDLLPRTPAESAPLPPPVNAKPQ